MRLDENLPESAEVSAMQAKLEAAAARAAEYPEEFRGFYTDLLITAEFSGTPKDWTYRSHMDMAIRLGTPRIHNPHVLPDAFPVMEPRQCYRNAHELVLDDPDRLYYVEGWAYGHVLPVQHAWVEDKLTGDIIDPTWADLDFDDPCFYLGIRFDANTHAGLVAAGGFHSAFFNDEKLNYPMLRFGVATDANGVVIGPLFDPEETA